MLKMWNDISLRKLTKTFKFLTFKEELKWPCYQS